MKPNETNQCSDADVLHCSIRVWPSVSLASVTLRCPGLSVRPTGWPSLMTDTMCPIVLPNNATPTAAIASETTMARICIPAMLLVGYRCSHVDAALITPACSVSLRSAEIWSCENRHRALPGIGCQWRGSQFVSF